MLLERAQSTLLLIDVQEKLTPLVMQSSAVIERCRWLMELAGELSVPQLISEQYPKGLGATITVLQSLVPEDAIIEKIQFSSWAEKGMQERLQFINNKQIILMGIETHVCVLQTAIDLLNAGFEVFVVVDAVSSRYEIDHKYGLKRMKQEGVQLVTAEMVFFEWLKQAGTPEFKVLSKRFF